MRWRSSRGASRADGGPRTTGCRRGSTRPATSPSSRPGRRRGSTATRGSSASSPRRGERRSWTWPQLMALPAERPVVDLHCVTKWSKFDTPWQGVSLDMLLADVETEAEYALVHSYGGYTTNLPLKDLLDGQAWIAYGYDGRDLAPEHGGPGAAAGAAPVPVEVGQMGARHPAAGARTSPGSGRAPAITTTETHGASSGTRATRPSGCAGGSRLWSDSARRRRPRARWCWTCRAGRDIWPASTSTCG